MVKHLICEVPEDAVIVKVHVVLQLTAANIKMWNPAAVESVEQAIQSEILHAFRALRLCRDLDDLGQVLFELGKLTQLPPAGITISNKVNRFVCLRQPRIEIIFATR